MWVVGIKYEGLKTHTFYNYFDSVFEDEEIELLRKDK